MSSSQSSSSVDSNKTFSIHSREPRLQFTGITWSTENGFSSVLLDEDIISSLQKPLPPPAAALQACYRISKVPGKGFGMFATKDINPGDRILVENPLLVVPKQIFAPFPFPPSFIYNILIAVYQDTPPFDAFFSLANSYPFTKDSLSFEDFVDASKKNLGADATSARGPVPFTCNISALPEGATVAGVKDAKAIAETNALEIQVHDPKWDASVALVHNAVFLDASRINHSCSPNASYDFHFRSWALSVTADRVISAGEEITIRYPTVNLLDPRESRLKMLNENHGFQCLCKTCDKPNEPKAIVESNKRREELRIWARTAPVMWKWFADFSLKDDYMLYPHIRALFLMHKEGLYLPQRKGHLVAIADTYAALGEHTKYIQWAKKVQEYHKSNNNVKSARNLEHLIADPESHPQWNLRIKAKEASKSKQKRKEIPAENGHIPNAPTPTGPCGTVTQEDVERWLADTNWTSTDLWTVRTSGVDESRPFIVRVIDIGDFESAILLDSVTLSLIPAAPFKPYPKSVLQDAFTIAPSSNKGLAMFATRNIGSGGIILAEPPALLCPVIAPDALKFLFDRLSPDQRQAVLSLANNKPPEVCSKYEGIFRTNCIQVNLPVEEGQPEISTNHAGVFLNISRCNHSCRPNAEWQWDLASWSMALIATRSIHAGEEITVAYIDNSQPREAHRRKLFKMYRFDCECERCHPAKV